MDELAEMASGAGGQAHRATSVVLAPRRGVSPDPRDPVRHLERGERCPSPGSPSRSWAGG